MRSAFLSGGTADLQKTYLWDEIQQGPVIPNISAEVDGVRVSPFVVGDSATWLMKP